ncbi:MAG: signal peptidase I [Ruminococcus sp.]|nr:signal peptidase I [Ruminococcus sp.]
MINLKKGIVCLLSIVLLIPLVLCSCGKTRVEVDGHAMEPTLKNGDVIFADPFNGDPKNGDIILIQKKSDYTKPLIKRVIAVEGQSLRLDYENERIFVDDIQISEPYIKDTTFSGVNCDYSIPEVIPEGKVFVLGDNRAVSLDSRSSKIGLVDVNEIIGVIHLE